MCDMPDSTWVTRGKMPDSKFERWEVVKLGQSYFLTFERLDFRTPIRTKQIGSPTSAVG